MTAAELAEALERAVPGAVVAHADGIDMPTLTVTEGHLLAVCRELRDVHGRNFLSAVSAVDNLGYGEAVAGYYGTERGRDINLTGSWGAPVTAAAAVHPVHRRLPPRPRRRLAARPRPRQVLLEDGESVPSVVGVWPTADWHEREQYDLMGIEFTGHPNLRRLIMPSDWAGHPLRKDYPIGGEPVQFTDDV